MITRFLLLLLGLVCTSLSAHSQQGLTFTQLPADLQLIARDSTNQASVIIQGAATSADPQRVSVQAWRDGQPWARSVVLLNTSRPASFSISVRIQAAKAQYTIRVFAHTGTDSVLVIERNRIVCGDFIQLYGQSNAIAFNPEYHDTVDDTYLRNCTFTIGTSPIEGRVSWYSSKMPYGTTGIIGWRLQELILNQFGIPTCIINGAVGGEGIGPLSVRTPANPADLNTYYGQTLFRHQVAQAVPYLRAIIWKQGETEAGGASREMAYYAQQFDQLYRNWRQDYGSRPRIYIGQINYLPGNNPAAGAIRDFQRRTKRLYTNVETIATVGTQGHDGIHYNKEGNLQIAGELFRQIARDLYQSTDTVQINSPDIQKAYYNPARDTITMVFDENQQMIWPADSILYNPSSGTFYSRRLLDFIYLNGQPGLIRSGITDGNRVILALTQPNSATSLTYLPPFLIDSYTTNYDGVHLKNGRGMRAFSFEGIHIASQLPVVPILSATVLPNNQVQLSWNVPATLPAGYTIERSFAINSGFKIIGRAGGTSTTFTDTELLPQPSVVYYRIRAVSATSESPASPATRVERTSTDMADLQLDMQTSARTVGINQYIAVTLTAHNKGPASASRIVVENRLPPNLVFVSGDSVAHTAGVISATAGSLSAHETASWTFMASVNQPGSYRNAAQIMQSSKPDPDSRPGSGTEDGEDDAATADFRTTLTGQDVYTSPNPFQLPLPPVQSAQPLPIAGKADLNLHMTASQLCPRLNGLLSITLIVTNTGAEPAANVAVRQLLPTQLVPESSPGWQHSGNQLETQFSGLPAGESRSVWFQARVVGIGSFVSQAQFISATPADPDSTPGNGYENGEDDTARILFRVL